MQELGAAEHRDGPSAPTDLGLASHSSLQPAFDHSSLHLSALGNAGEPS